MLAYLLHRKSIAGDRSMYRGNTKSISWYCMPHSVSIILVSPCGRYLILRVVTENTCPDYWRWPVVHGDVAIIFVNFYTKKVCEYLGVASNRTEHCLTYSDKRIPSPECCFFVQFVYDTSVTFVDTAVGENHPFQLFQPTWNRRCWLLQIGN